jgi:hypothetical protein
MHTTQNSSQFTGVHHGYPYPADYTGETMMADNMINENVTRENVTKESITREDMINMPVYMLNPTATRQQLEDQARLHCISIKALFDILPEEPLVQIDSQVLIRYFSLLEQLVCELQELLVEAQ